MPAIAILGPLLIPIAKKLIKFGMSKLPGAMFGGAAGEAVAGTVIDTIAGKLGIEPTPEALETAIETRGPEIGAIVDENAEYWAGLWETQVIEQNKTMRAEMSAKSVFTRNWRPFVGFAFGFECLALVFTTCGLLISGTVPAFDAFAPILSILGTVFTAQAGVVGVYAYQRTQEKKAGAA